MNYRAGRLCEDGVFRVWITGKQVFRMVGNCGGILEETIRDLWMQPYWSGVEITVQNGKFAGIYYYTKDQSKGMRSWQNRYGQGAQRLFPLRDVYKRLN